ncbi:hypothetical protein CLV78_10518 [Aliiruegeria haliotis]|uniref:Phospholipase A2-like protein n=1 Tax=Aliiruegeria haliotis TaxID=1280846 RepID=A0A2T0RP37_9RHOB|nr:hypothetical protein [Aliiruegeria haliotis]PRY22966.1 hypothetical protein CLV78_10518 [Aliiruegeria haliotis]
MPRRRLLAAAAALAALPMSGLSADGLTTGVLSRAVELPAHEWLSAVRTTPDAEPDVFVTDGCSGGMSSLWTYTAERYPAFAEAHNGVPPWESCCVTHDRAYHTGGDDPDPEASYAARVSADEALRACVAATADDRDAILRDLYGMTEPQVRLAYEAIATAMFQAVRLGGGPCTGLPWRWGFGYPHCWSRAKE